MFVNYRPLERLSKEKINDLITFGDFDRIYIVPMKEAKFRKVKLEGMLREEAEQLLLQVEHVVKEEYYAFAADKLFSLASSHTNAIRSPEIQD